MDVKQTIATICLAGMVCAFATSVHELSHLLACQLLRCKVLSYKVLFLFFDGNQLMFQINGKNHCAFVSSDKIKTKLVTVAGPVAEVALSIFLLFVSAHQKQRWVKMGLIIGTIITILLVVINLIPSTNGDGKILFGKDRFE